MFKTAAAVAALTVIISSSAMAQVLTAGQFLGVTQYTALYDPANICAGLGLAAGQVSNSVATIGGLGKAWTSVIATANGNGTSGNPYGVTPITCSFPKLPTASGFVANGDGSYTATPAGSQVTTCVSTKGTFTLTSSNTSGGSLPTTNTATLINNGTGNTDSGLAINTTNTALASGGTTLCYLSTSALYLNTKK